MPQDYVRMVARWPETEDIFRTLCGYADLGNLVVEGSNADYAELEEAVGEMRKILAQVDYGLTDAVECPAQPTAPTAPAVTAMSRELEKALTQYLVIHGLDMQLTKARKRLARAEGGLDNTDILEYMRLKAVIEDPE